MPLHARHQPATQPATPDASLSGAEAEVRELLAKRIPEVRFEQSPLGDAIDFLRNTTGANIFVNWRTLESVSVSRDAAVTLRMRGVPLDTVLRLLLEEAGGGTVRLGYATDQNVITISTDEDVARMKRAARARAGPRTEVGEYYVSGVERAGVYAVSSRNITLEQRAVRRGRCGHRRKARHHRPSRPAHGTTSRVVYAVNDLMEDRGIGGATVEKGDVLMVTADPPPNAQTGGGFCGRPRRSRPIS